MTIRVATRFFFNITQKKNHTATKNGSSIAISVSIASINDSMLGNGEPPAASTIEGSAQILQRGLMSWPARYQPHRARRVCKCCTRRTEGVLRRVSRLMGNVCGDNTATEPVSVPHVAECVCE
eukprot:3635451-Rhodomonas_salina.4